jgi:SAM-dependent methyltransferase
LPLNSDSHIADNIDPIQRERWDNVDRRRTPDHPTVHAFATGVINSFAHCLGKGSVLEVGCGNGHMTVPLSERGRVVALDFSLPMLRLNPAAGRTQALADGLPFADNAFPVVFCQGLLHHCPDPAAVVAEMARVSSRWVVAHEPNCTNPAMAAFSLSKRSEWGALKFRRGYLKRIFSSAGLNINTCHSRGMILPNKTPGSLVGFSQRLEGISLLTRMLGFYLLAIGEKK